MRTVNEEERRVKKTVIMEKSFECYYVAPEAEEQEEEGNQPEAPACACEEACTAEAMNAECAVCGAEGASVENCCKYVAPAKEEPEPELELTAAEKVQAMIDALPKVEELENADDETVEAAYEAIQDVYDALDELSEEELDQITGLDKLAALLEWFTGPVSTYEGKDFDYTLDETTGTITITGITDTSMTEVIIPAKIDGGDVTAIGDQAFKNCKSLTSITIPNSVTSIGNSAFYNCTSLTSIEIPSSVTSVYENAFLSCQSLESIFLPKDLAVTGAGIPDATSQVRYTLDTNKGKVTITGIDLGTDKTGVVMPATICGYPVVAVEEGLLEKISSHTCAGGEATCQTKAICGICKQEYGDYAGHTLTKTEARDATCTEDGNTAYWTCSVCHKLFGDENGTNEIILDDTVIAKLPPEIIEGKGQSITAGEKKELTFRSNAAFSDFICVEIDGKTLDEKNYTAKEGSTVVTLNADYVSTLPAGEHTIGIVSESGTAATTFTVNAKADSTNSPQAETINTNTPQTGDNSPLALWIALLLASGCLLAVTVIYGKKKKYNR